MDEQPKRPRLKRDWVGRRVRTLRELSNQLATIPAGTIMHVERNYAGLTLTTAACERCGVKVRITKVWQGDVELLAEGDTHAD